MNPLDFGAVHNYCDSNLADLHDRCLNILKELQFEILLTEDSYLFKARSNSIASSLITSLLDSFLSDAEEKLFGDFLEGLAIFIAGMTCGGHKSTAPGVDLEFVHKDIHYIVSVKSWPNWGNSSQQSKLEQDLKNAVARVKQSRRGTNVQPVLGICYGKTRTSYLRGYMKVVGQNFWYLISENEHLYTDIIEPVGYRAKEHNEAFLMKKNALVNRFTGEFIGKFCDPNGVIDWVKLVEFNSGNFDLDKFLDIG
ncbi:MAG: PmeII family type II restriction endonuclease [Chloroflexota bacterium]